jgi:hypothetical protein
MTPQRGIGRKLPQISSVKNIHEKEGGSINRGLSRATLELSNKNNGGLGSNLSQNERNYIDNIKNKNQNIQSLK